MSDPRRWNDPDADAPQGARTLLRAANGPPPMPDEVRAAVSKMVTGLGPSAPWWVTHARWLQAAGLGAAVSVAAVTSAVYRSPQHAPTHARVAPNAPLAPRVATPARELPSPAPEVTPPVVAAPAHAASPTTDAPAPYDEARERLWIERAQRALADGRPADALGFAQRHARLFPDGQWTEEREDVAVRALVALGRDDEARPRCRSFLRRFPSGIYSARVRRECERLQ